MMPDPVYVVAHVEAYSGFEDTLRSALLELVDTTKAELGFIRYDLREDIANPGHFHFCEVWRDKASLDLHGTVPQMAAYAALASHRVKSVTVETSREINS